MYDHERRYLSIVAVAVLISISVAALFNGVADAANKMTVEVENARITLNVLAAPSATYFVVIGDIVEVDGEPASGKFYCEGVFVDPVSMGLPPLIDGAPAPDGGTFVDQRFIIDGVGSIIGVGSEFSQEPLALTGGTGLFVGAHGSYVGE